MTKYNIELDEEQCVGCGVCTQECDNFEMDESKAKVKQSIVTDIGCNQKAADACPVNAIVIKKTK